MLTRAAIAMRRKDGRERCRTCAHSARKKPNAVRCEGCGAERNLTRAGARYAARTGKLCYQCSAKARERVAGAADPKWKGCGAITGSAVCGWRAGARHREIEWLVSIQELDAIWQRQAGRCALTGLALSNQKGSPSKASLDRIDSTRPYVADNLQFVCARVNRMKQDAAQDEFVKFCALVAAHAASAGR
jgi:hypothetical protein